MKRILKILHIIKKGIISFLLNLIIVTHASAHLMVEQHGTLNFKPNGVFMVLSLPVSAFENIDDDKDGKMSATEFNKYHSLIIETVKEHVLLTDNDSKKQLPLQGVLLSPVVSHEDNNDGTEEETPSEQVVIMGRFSLENIKTTDKLDFNVDLFGKKAKEKKLTITATRTIESQDTAQKHKIELIPENTVKRLFSQQAN